MSLTENRGMSKNMPGAIKSRTLWIALGVTALGVLLGFALMSPLLSLTVSIVGILVHLVAILANPLHGLLLWMVSNPFGFLYINISLGHGFPDLSPTRFCVAFLSTLLMAQVVIRKRELVPFTAADTMGVLLMFGLSLSAISDYSELQEGLQGVFDGYLVPLLVYFFTKNLITQRRDVDKVLLAVLLLGVYAGVYAIYESLTGNILFIRKEIHFTMYGDSGLHILRGLLDRSDHFGALFCMAIPVNFYLYLKTPSRARKILYVVALAVLFIGIYFTYKRTAWIALVVILLVTQWFWPQFRRVFYVLLFVFLVVLGATWNTVGQSVVVTDRINSKVSTSEGRTDGWNAAIDLWARRPLFGYGHGNYRTVAEEKGVDDAAIESEHLSILFGSGLVGFLPYVGWYVALLRDSIHLFRGIRRRDAKKPRVYVDRDLVVVFWGALLGYLINYTMTSAVVYSVTMVFYVLAGALVGSQAGFLVSLRKADSEARPPVATAG